MRLIAYGLQRVRVPARLGRSCAHDSRGSLFHMFGGSAFGCRNRPSGVLCPSGQVGFSALLRSPAYRLGVLSRAVWRLSPRCRARWASPLTHAPTGALRESGRGLCPRFFLAYGVEFASFGNRGFPMVQLPIVFPRFPNVDCPPFDVLF